MTSTTRSPASIVGVAASTNTHTLGPVVPCDTGPPRKGQWTMTYKSYYLYQCDNQWYCKVQYSDRINSRPFKLSPSTTARFQRALNDNRFQVHNDPIWACSVLHIRRQFPTQSTMFPSGEDTPLFTGQPVECNKYDARGYQPKEHYRQLDMWKENT
jgi:hypothetical protein